MKQEPVIYELSSSGRVGVQLPPLRDPQKQLNEYLPTEEIRNQLPLPEVSQIDVVRHFVRLSQLNFSIDSDMYPLGSCTMKYNPKINEVTGRLSGLSSIHPYQPDDQIQGALKLLWHLQGLLSEIAGFPGVTLQPSAGAQGEFTGLMLIRAMLTEKDSPRSKVLIPDSAHGTNPATATMCGYKSVGVPSGSDGEIDIESVRRLLDEDVAAIMMTVPNTLGVFETRIEQVCEMAHAAGAQVYCDGANMNAMVGRVRPGDLGIDVMHLNLHKTFSTPHGGGGPGAGALCVKEHLIPYLPGPTVEVDENDQYSRKHTNSRSIGKVHSHMGNFGNLVRAYTYILSNGKSGLKSIADNAVLNANYVRVQLRDRYDLPFDRTCMHEVVFSGTRQKTLGASTLDIAKRLIDYGFHPPTIYFPLIVPEALMIEPTETESRETIDRFVEALRSIADEAERDSSILRDAPVSAPLGRLDEATAARQPDLRYSQP